MSFAQDLQIDWLELHKVDLELPVSLLMERLEGCLILMLP
jgi:hypothetical protein